MSTQPINSSSFGTLSSLGTGAPLQITGLASGLDTNSIVQKLMAIQQQPVTQLQNEQTGMQDQNTALTSIQTALQNLSTSAQALASTSLFASTQNAASTNATLVSATATSGNGAVQGGYQITVSQLASSSQRTYSFTSPTAADTITIDGQQISLTANAKAQDFVNAVNANSNVDVWATLTNSNTVVLSDRATGAPPSAGSFISASAPGVLSEQTSLAQAGVNAQYTINGVAGQSSSNTITGAPLSGTPSATNAGATQTIAGVSLTLNGVTTGGSPVTVSVSPPAPNTQSIQSAIQSFVTSYNSVIGQIQTQLAQKPSSSDPSQGTLYADSDMTNLLASMRQAMYASGSGLQPGMATMMDVGVSTGAASGSAAPSQSAIAGNLALNAQTLTAALQSNPMGVQQVLQKWSLSFSSLVNNEADPGGTIDSRVQGNSSQISNLANQITTLNQMLAQKQQALTQQFAQLEAVLSQNQSTSSWLTSQIASLPTP